MLNKITYTILGFSLAFVFFPHSAKDYTRQPVVSGVSIAQTDAILLAAPELAVSLSAPMLSAKAALAYDLDSGTILYSKNLDDQLPIASLTKLMTALVVLDRVDFDSELQISSRDQTAIGNTIGLVAGEKITIGDLLQAMLIPSANDAALALANFVAGSPEKFSELMNQKALKLNLAATNFSNPVGWDSWSGQPARHASGDPPASTREASRAGAVADGENFSNTLDLIKVVRELLRHDELRQIVKTRETTVSSTDGKYVHQLRSTNKLLLENSEIEGIKTGFTSKALGNMIILNNRQGHQIITIVLGSEDREDDSQKLLDWALKVYRW